MFIKICATTTLADARLALTAGADALGFVFAPSQRRVTPAQVGAIVSELPAGTRAVGVFTTADADELIAAADEAGLTALQLHSDFNPQLVRVLHAARPQLQLIQVVSVRTGEADTATTDALQRQLTTLWSEPAVYAVLVDAMHGGASGGTGKSFDWTAFAPAILAAQHATGGRLIVAGGLRPANVGDAIEQLRPWGVDVASGVEASPGHKSEAKLAAFIAAARAPTTGTGAHEA